MKIRTLILDDDANSRLAARTALAQYEDVELAAEFADSRGLLGYLAKNTAQLLFLDIELKDEFGFSVAETLRRDYPELLIVFLTGHSSYAIDGYGVEPVNFLTKPINPAKLEQTIRQVRQRLAPSGQQRSAQLMFRLHTGYHVIDVRDILYIERQDRKNILHTVDGEFRMGVYSMHELEEMLAPYGFFLCHQSFLLSLYRVQILRDAGRQLYEAVLRDAKMPVPVSRNRYDAMKQALEALHIRVL